MKKTISLGDSTKSNYIEILEEEQKQIDPPMRHKHRKWIHRKGGEYAFFTFLIFNLWNFNWQTGLLAEDLVSLNRKSCQLK